MTSRVYWITLELIQRRVKNYIGRYDTQLQASLTTQQYNCVRAVFDAIVTCLAALPHNTPT
jgi:hypothetical protein